MSDVNLTYEMVIDTGRRYGEEFDRSQVDKWLKGVNSSKAVRVMLAMMRREALNRGDLVMPEEPDRVVEVKKEKVEAKVEAKPEEMVPEDYGLEEVALANFKYEAPGSRDGWKWDGRQLQVCYREQVYATREYVEIGGYVSLEGDLMRLDHDGKLIRL